MKLILQTTNLIKQKYKTTAICWRMFELLRVHFVCVVIKQSHYAETEKKSYISINS